MSIFLLHPIAITLDDDHLSLYGSKAVDKIQISGAQRAAANKLFYQFSTLTESRRKNLYLASSLLASGFSFLGTPSSSGLGLSFEQQSHLSVNNSGHSPLAEKLKAKMKEKQSVADKADSKDGAKIGVFSP